MIQLLGGTRVEGQTFCMGAVATVLFLKILTLHFNICCCVGTATLFGVSTASDEVLYIVCIFDYYKL